MKRYIIFAGRTFYPGGGLRDYICSTDNLETAHTIAKSAVSEAGYADFQADWSHIYDAKEDEAVAEYGENHSFNSPNMDAFNNKIVPPT